MLKKSVFALALVSALGLTGCDKIKAMTQKTVACNDPVALELIEEQLQKDILSATKNYLQFNNNNVDIALIKQAVSHLKVSVDNIGNGEKDGNSSKNICTGELIVGLNKSMLERAEEVRKANGELPIQDFAFRQDIELLGTQVQHQLKYSTQPTDTADKVSVELMDVNNLQEFIAKIIVDASQQGDLSPVENTASAVASTPTVASVVVASAPTPTVPPTPSAVGPAGTTADDEAEPEIDTEAISQAELAKIKREQAKAKAQVDFKRKEFNELWNSASAEAQESLTDDQKQWVIDRDATCTEEAQDAEPAYQETVRMQCVARLLGERYYEVKEYFNNYE